jgi:hypothetical protein
MLDRRKIMFPFHGTVSIDTARAAETPARGRNFKLARYRCGPRSPFAPGG